MSKRKKTSGGQAIVMVTLALFSMVGMMGLSVDLGWSYFAQKQAQASADSAALSAAQEAVSRLGVSNNVSGYRCTSTGTGAGQVECTEQPGGTVLEYCGSSVASTSNLNNGCLYAKRNGFQYDVTGSRQIVSVQSGDVTDVNAPPGLKRISYWVRVRTIQRIPQLFSFLAGNQQGTVAANGTAAIAGSTTPGSFYGMNHAGDCWSLPGAATPSHCGMDLDARSTGQGKTACPGSGGGSGQACAPAGIILSSTCNASSPSGSTCSQQWAGNATTGNGVETGSLVVMGTNASNGGATPGDWHDSTGKPIAPTYTTAAASFKDPTAPNPQPPLQTTNPIPTCGLPGGNFPNNATAGPYQYYAYTNLLNGKPQPTGAPINIGGTVTFSSSAGCPGVAGGGTAQGSFGSYVFYGGLNVGGTMNLTAGQYVLAGVSSSAANSTVLNVNGTIQPGDGSATSTGTMFVFTDGSYPGLGGPQAQGNSGTGQITNLPNWTSMPALYQGNLNFKNPDITMTGLVNTAVGGSALPGTMNGYTGVVWWQDRRNSMVEYNQDPSKALNCTNCTKDDGSVVGCADTSPTNGCSSAQTTAEIVTDNHVTSTSPGQVLDPGNGTLNLTGVYYQPRGAWLQLVHGTGLGTGGLQTVTGSLDLSTGDDRFLLVGPTNPLISYKAVLVQ